MTTPAPETGRTSEEVREFRKALALACNDPGHFVGFKGERSLGEWQVDALLAGPLAQLVADRDSALQVMEMNATSGAFYARHAENATKRAEVAEAEAAQLRSQLLQAEKGAEAMREACLKAAIGASYGPPSSWPGPYPKGWRHPPCWEPDQRPTPDQAAWHDNGARDAWFAIRALAAKAAPLPDSDTGGRDGR